MNALRLTQHHKREYTLSWIITLRTLGTIQQTEFVVWKNKTVSTLVGQAFMLDAITVTVAYSTATNWNFPKLITQKSTAHLFMTFKELVCFSCAITLHILNSCMFELINMLEDNQHHWCSGNILAFQAGAPGSIPGWCNWYWCCSQHRSNLILPLHMSCFVKFIKQTLSDILHTLYFI